MPNKKNKDLIICDALIEIGEKHKMIANLFPKENEHILKHLAAAAIHISLFARDFHDITMGVKTSLDNESIEQFLKKCGCDFHKKDLQ